ncbi:cell division protein FtsH [Affinibrenneria salicis]|uniref:Cell division protein FtsH n=1 Tax=Affinibrenneria salicis TaxID=2590031 RepID=A0A5J5G6M2_9GAMM|nr:YqjK-like family protein [Affinibrenneria salicis]KAA9002829.1 cell division protein FtsH [Affinibrenneria salicis]KAA9002884.1 cell division protein FtsH [Affinibrenneria salicis]
MSRTQRERDKARLLRHIQQQRLDLSASKKQWLETTETCDRYFGGLLGLRKYLLAGAGVMAVYGLRHPGKLVLWTRRAIGAWGTIKFLRKALQR